MKKSLLILAIALVGSLVASAQITDTIVSLTPSNRNVVLEEYTGINCQYCPCGHKNANNVKAAHPDRVCLINIHTGGYAAAYQTSFGSALMNQTGLTGFPSGTINRHVFSGSNTAISYGDFNTRANQILAMSSPVNIAAEGTLDWATRTVTIRVQLYYTGTQTVSSNSLNIAITQDNVIGPQIINSGCSYPQMMVGDQYRHMHMLRHLMCGQWGETIDNITQGTLIEKTYEYQIPYKFGITSQAINAYLEDLRFVAFVSEGHQEILTGVDVPVEIINRPAVEARITEVVENAVLDCSNQCAAKIHVTNSGLSEDLSSIGFTYTVAGVEQTAQWSGTLAPGESTVIDIPTFDIVLNENNVLSVLVTSVNGEAVESGEQTLDITKNVVSGGGYMYFKFVQDRYGDESRFKFFGPDGNVVLSGGPFSQLNSNTTKVHEFDFKPTVAGCYRLEVYDGYGDGINAGYGAGYFELWNSQSDVLIKNNGKFGEKAVYFIEVSAPYAVQDVDMIDVTVYPNPAYDNVTVAGTENVTRIEIFNMQGQLVKTEAGSTQIGVKDLANGIYMMKVTSDKGTTIHKIVKK